MGTLRSVNVGMPRNVSWQGCTVYTGVWRTPVDGPVTVHRLNVHGDGQGDLAGHGGQQRALRIHPLSRQRPETTALHRQGFASTPAELADAAIADVGGQR